MARCKVFKNSTHHHHNHKQIFFINMQVYWYHPHQWVPSSCTQSRSRTRSLGAISPGSTVVSFHLRQSFSANFFKVILGLPIYLCISHDVLTTTRALLCPNQRSFLSLKTSSKASSFASISGVGAGRVQANPLDPLLATL